MMTTLSRAFASKYLSQLAQGVLDLDEMRRRFAPAITGGDLFGTGNEGDLIASVAFALEDESIDEEAHRLQAGRLAAALDSPLSNEEILVLLPLILGSPRLCSVLSKLEAGTVSRTGYLSFIAESPYGSEAKRWLLAASMPALRELGQMLQNCDYAGAARCMAD
jgi:hypothetical protein